MNSAVRYDMIEIRTNQELEFQRLESLVYVKSTNYPYGNMVKIKGHSSDNKNGPKLLTVSNEINLYVRHDLIGMRMD